MGRHLPLALLVLLQPVAPACRAARAPKPSGPPRRGGCLPPSLTALLVELGAGDRVVGVTRFCDHPPAAALLPKVGGYIDPSVEAVAALAPDLVLAVPSPANRRPVEAMGRLGLRVELVSDRTLADVRAGLSTVGRLVHAEPSAAAALARLDAGLAAVRGAVIGRDRPKTLLVYGHRPLVVAAPTSFAGELLRLAGGDNVVQGGEGYPILPMEKVLALAPDVIVDIAMAPLGGSPSDIRAFWTRWPSLPAVANRRVHGLDQGPLMRPGPRAPEALRALAVVLHPEVALP